jgi:hypothetical protein
MHSMKLRFLAAASVVMACGAAFGADAVSQSVALAQSQVKQAFPGVQIARDESSVVRVYGRRMSGHTDADAAVQAWLAAHASSLGATNPTLELERMNEVSFGRFTVYSYDQTIDGLPVEHSHARVLVRHGESNDVVYAAGRLAEAPADGFAPDAFSADDALRVVQGDARYGFMTEWTEPTMVVFFGETEATTPIRAWRFTGDNGILESRAKYTFYVDAATGAIAHVHNDILHVDVEGDLAGNATPGVLPDTPGNPPTALPIPLSRVSISGGSSTFTDVAGFFVIPHGGSSPVTVTAGVTNARWATVNNVAGGEISVSGSTTPPGPISLLLNDTPSEFETAQVNGLIHTNLTHQYFTDRAPGFTGLDTVLPVNVNISDTCNAYFDGGSINFFRVGGGCYNSAYTTVVAHEYGHFIVNRLGLAQGAFGEGYSDCVAMLLYDTPIVGENFFTSGGFIRYPINSGVDYPCSGGVHFCGQILGGAFWGIRENFGATYGSQAGLELTRQLHVDWSLITSGGSGDNSAHPGTAIEVLTVDDDDGDLGNGTPNYADICDAFDNVNIDCPELLLIGFDYPAGQPEILDPNTPTVVRFDVTAISGAPIEGSGQLWYSTGGGFTPAGIVEIAPNQYEATIPGVDCGVNVAYYVSAEETGGTTIYDPKDAPIDVFTAVSATGQQADLDEFEADSGWTVGAAGDDATTGVWTRMNPSPTQAQPGDDHTPTGTDCWVTDGRGGGLGDYDVDGGKTTLVSPAFDLSNAAGARVSYWRWYSNDTGATPNTDVFVVEISDDGGATWQNLETVGPTGEGTSGGWIYHEAIVSDFVGLTDNVRVRFIASDEGSGSIVEAAVDDFEILTYECDEACEGDLNGDGTRDLADLGILLASFEVDDGGDINGDGITDLADLGALLAVFDTDCP